MCRDLEALRQSMCQYGESFDAASLSPAEAGHVVKLCAAIEASAAALKSLAAARLAEGGSWRHEGYQSPEEQLADRTGVGTGQARRALQTAKRLSDHPQVAQAAALGELSASQAELIAIGAEADRSKTKDLIDKAKSSSLGELRDEVAQVRAHRTDLEAQRRRIHEARKLRSFTDLEGAWRLAVSGNVEDGMTLTRLLTPVRQRLNRLRRDAGQALQTFEQLDYDALITVARIACGHDSDLSLADLLDLGLFPHHDGLAADGLREAAGPEPKSPGGRADQPSSAPPHRRDPSSTAGPTNPHPLLPTGPTRARRPTTWAAPPDPNRRAPRPPDLAASVSTSAHSADTATPLPFPTDPPPACPRDADECPPLMARTSEILDRPAARPGPTGQPAHRSPKLVGRPINMIIRVDLDTLLRGVPIEGELCEIPGVGPIPVSLIHDLMANGLLFISALLTKSQQVVGVYRQRRRPDAHQRTALDFLYPTCAAAGCDRRAGLDYEHREDWAKTSYTVYDLMDRLCWFHHQQKTHHGWKLTEGSGKRAFVPPGDPRHPDQDEAIPRPELPAAPTDWPSG
ncbi:MAG: DUF222 domain-containing protein [Acidobacteriota bacterium]|nr:DUF222 domain-containing protein [Acidobacteriota bacterium]